MSYAFDYPKHTCYFKTVHGVEFLLQLRPGITMVDGDSATGKSYLVQCIRAYQRQEEDNFVMDEQGSFSNICTVTNSHELVWLDFQKREQLIILDNASLYVTPKLSERIRTDIYNPSVAIFLTQNSITDFLI